MSNPIIDFLELRKQARLKTPGKRTDAEIEEEFRTDVWVENAARRVSQLNLVSHPGKFSHPDARITPVLYAGSRVADGYLRSGNASAADDVVGNAAALDVYAFLSLVLDDGQSVLEHFEQNSEVLQKMLGVKEDVFLRWRDSFLEIKQSSGQAKSHFNVKQVYFPVEDGYHLLSVLYPSGLMAEHRTRIRQMKFSDETKEAREARRKNECRERGYFDLPGLLTQNFGGTKPQNISKLNSNNGGEAWLIPCLPPEIQQQYLHLPKRDFFRSLRWDQYLRDTLDSLHKLFVTDYNNIDIRSARKRRIEQLFDWVLGHAYALQRQPSGWSDREGFQLPVAQKVWLDAAWFDKRDDYENWRDDIARATSEWVVVTYKRYRKRRNDAVPLGTVEVTAFQQEMLDYAREQEEVML